MKKLQNQLGYQFNDIHYLTQALTRESAINERDPRAASKSYQTLELVGDAAIKSTLSALLVLNGGQDSEGSLNAVLEPLIRNDGVMLEIANTLNIECYLIKSAAEPITDKVKVDAVEAVIGAVQLDCMANTKKQSALTAVINRLWSPYLPKQQAAVSAVSSAAAAESSPLPGSGGGGVSIAVRAKTVKSNNPQRALSPSSQRLFSATGLGKKAKSQQPFSDALKAARDVNRKNIGKRGDTPLGTICRKAEITPQREAMIQALVAKGALWTIRNNLGKTPQDILREKHPAVAARLCP